MISLVLVHSRSTSLFAFTSTVSNALPTPLSRHPVSSSPFSIYSFHLSPFHLLPVSYFSDPTHATRGGGGVGKSISAPAPITIRNGERFRISREMQVGSSRRLRGRAAKFPLIATIWGIRNRKTSQRNSIFRSIRARSDPAKNQQLINYRSNLQKAPRLSQHSQRVDRAAPESSHFTRRFGR